jgi:hypothetical protein
MRLKRISPNCCSTFAAWKPRYVSVCNRWWRPMSYRGTLCNTTKTQKRKFETIIPRKGTARLQSQFLHSCFCERFTYIPLIGLPILLQENSWAERRNVYTVDRPETQNWNWGRTISFQGIHKSNFHCSACTVKSSFKTDLQTYLYRSLI